MGKIIPKKKKETKLCHWIQISETDYGTMFLELDWTQYWDRKECTMTS